MLLASFYWPPLLLFSVSKIPYIDLQIVSGANPKSRLVFIRRRLLAKREKFLFLYSVLCAKRARSAHKTK